MSFWTTQPNEHLVVSTRQLWPRTGKTAHVARPLNDSNLETKTDAQERDLLLACPFNGSNHSLGTTHTEAAGNDDTSVWSVHELYYTLLGGAYRTPGIVVADWIVDLCLGFEISRIDPLASQRGKCRVHVPAALAYGHIA